jgi:hypothetical protein
MGIYDLVQMVESTTDSINRGLLTTKATEVTSEGLTAFILTKGPFRIVYPYIPPVKVKLRISYAKDDAYMKCPYPERHGGKL